MGREAKGHKELPQAIATLPPLPGGTPDLRSTWGPARGAVRAADDVPKPSTRWFDTLDPHEAPPPPRPRRAVFAVPLLVAALVLVATTRSLALRALLPLALSAAAALLVVRARRPRRVAPEQKARRGLTLEGDRLTLHVRGQTLSHALLSLDEAFGVTILAAPRRDRVLALLSSSTGTAYVGAAFDSAARRAFATLVDRATAVSADEVGLEAIGPDGEPLVLAPATLAALVDALVERSPGCLERFLLTDARGAPLRLDGRELLAGGGVFDLSAPLEWRAFVFQESLGQAVALYQGTWIRQGASEVVLVCLLPAMMPAPEGEGVPLASLDRGALRDLRLMQGAPEVPPPADQRVAIDRLLMVPIRSALDKAPRPAAQPPRARA